MFSHSSAGRKSKIKATLLPKLFRKLLPSRVQVLAAPGVAGLVAASLSPSSRLPRILRSACGPSWKDSFRTRWGPTLMTSSSLGYVCEDSVSKSGAVIDRYQRLELQNIFLGGHTSVHKRWWQKEMRGSRLSSEKSCCLVAQSCLALCDLLDCSPPGSSVHGVLQARRLGWAAVSSSGGSSWPRDGTCVFCISRRVLYHWATREAPERRRETQ